ncbi:hypothetical protein ASPZODRAFT_12537 [Penicilliopsis zonata CBS 506.65]|uniref:Ketoreductase domain-containing protein n=1 Tax=Penicilliopsis zonata CBS 506.65 TaxID=1073090 RepID=A0A1L9SX14_9EURO|nr:hypothetical protein ASPZODRAFT_12537 [Penicilliopsis zonata CBS 506.65]OJJ51724.1 hypothetical protein ASPZODRAFT_12537 [Penicilliopsis zonata CBS 506.65]
MANQLVWLITGCSSGLGEAVAYAILAKGDKVVATARPRDGVSGRERLAALEAAGAAVVELDVTESQESLDAKAKQIWDIYGHIDVLLNNAGFIDAGIFEEINEQVLVNSLRNNVLGPLNLTRSFLPSMRARQTGTVLFMSSVGAYYGAPGASNYSASKGLLEGIVPNMAAELAPFGIRFCLLTPGYFRTKVMTPGNIHYFSGPNQRSEYKEMNKLVQDHCNAADSKQPGDPHKAAVLIVDAVRAEGRCAGKTLPLRLPIGPDGFKAVKDNCAEKMAICEEWGEIMADTDLS